MSRIARSASPDVATIIPLRYSTYRKILAGSNLVNLFNLSASSHTVSGANLIFTLILETFFFLFVLNENNPIHSSVCEKLSSCARWTWTEYIWATQFGLLCGHHRLHNGTYICTTRIKCIYFRVFVCGAVSIWSRLDGWVCRPEALAPHQTVADRLAYI